MCDSGNVVLFEQIDEGPSNKRGRDRPRKVLTAEVRVESKIIVIALFCECQYFLWFCFEMSCWYPI